MDRHYNHFPNHHHPPPTKLFKACKSLIVSTLSVPYHSLTSPTYFNPPPSCPVLFHQIYLTLTIPLPFPPPPPQPPLTSSPKTHLFYSSLPSLLNLHPPLSCLSFLCLAPDLSLSCPCLILVLSLSCS